MGAGGENVSISVSMERKHATRLRLFIFVFFLFFFFSNGFLQCWKQKPHHDLLFAAVEIHSLLF